MEIVNDVIADIEDNVDNLEGQVTVLFGDQVIRDEQLLELGTATESVYIFLHPVVIQVSDINFLQFVDCKKKMTPQLLMFHILAHKWRH